MRAPDEKQRSNKVHPNNKKPFAVGSDSICMKLPGNKVDCLKYGTKWNKFLVSIL